MIPTDTDLFLSSVRSEASKGLEVAPEDALRLLALVEEHGREVLRLRATQPSLGAAEQLRALARAYELDSSPLLTRRLLEIADSLVASPGGSSGEHPEARVEGGLWVSCGLEGLSLHDSADEARSAAEEWLGACRERAPEGWPEETVGIMWGEVIVRGRVVEIEHRPRADGDPPGPWDEWVDYALRPVVRP